MELYARVNILNGRAVRLPHGDILEAVSLEADPIARAASWVEKGVKLLHVVDLDAAAYGDYRNRPMIRDLIEASDVPVQVAGGVRTPQEVGRLLEAGAWRVVMGTAAIENQIMVWDLCRENPGMIVVSLDVRPDEELLVRGWTAGSGRYLEEVLIEMSSAGAGAIMLTEAGRDALAEPPNFGALRRAIEIVEEPVIAAGGVRDLNDLRALLEVDVNGRQIGGVVVGREVTEGRFTMPEALALFEAD
jgi:phosphoribosylformimino-5-aminoimidazole carboxamide ribotide isomerase